jgi:hypothetical protein
MIHFEKGWESNGRSRMDLNVIRDMDATNENNFISREGSLNGIEMTSSIVSYKEVKRCQVVEN